MSAVGGRLPTDADAALMGSWMAFGTAHPDVTDPPTVYRAGLLAGVRLAMRVSAAIGTAVPAMVLLCDLLNEAPEIKRRAS